MPKSKLSDYKAARQKALEILEANKKAAEEAVRKIEGDSEYQQKCRAMALKHEKEVNDLRERLMVAPPEGGEKEGPDDEFLPGMQVMLKRHHSERLALEKPYRDAQKELEKLESDGEKQRRLDAVNEEYNRGFHPGRRRAFVVGGVGFFIGLMVALTVPGLGLPLVLLALLGPTLAPSIFREIWAEPFRRRALMVGVVLLGLLAVAAVMASIVGVALFTVLTAGLGPLTIAGIAALITFGPLVLAEIGSLFTNKERYGYKLLKGIYDVLAWTANKTYAVLKFLASPFIGLGKLIDRFRREYPVPFKVLIGVLLVAGVLAFLVVTQGAGLAALPALLKVFGISMGSVATEISVIATMVSMVLAAFFAPFIGARLANRLFGKEAPKDAPDDALKAESEQPKAEEKSAEKPDVKPEKGAGSGVEMSARSAERRQRLASLVEPALNGKMRAAVEEAVQQAAKEVEGVSILSDGQIRNIITEASAAAGRAAQRPEATAADVGGAVRHIVRELLRAHIGPDKPDAVFKNFGDRVSKAVEDVYNKEALKLKASAPLAPVALAPAPSAVAESGVQGEMRKKLLPLVGSDFTKDQVERVITLATAAAEQAVKEGATRADVISEAATNAVIKELGGVVKGVGRVQAIAYAAAEPIFNRYIAASEPVPSAPSLPAASASASLVSPYPSVGSASPAPAVDYGGGIRRPSERVPEQGVSVSAPSVSPTMAAARK